MLVAWVLLVEQSAHAHGAFPTAEAIGFGPGTGEILFGTNFGAIHVARDGAQRFICETAVTGLPQALIGWLWLETGEVVGIGAPEGLARGVFVSDPSACGYQPVAGTEAFSMTDLASDALDGRVFYATGADDGHAVLLRGRPGEPATLLHSDTERPLPAPTGVRAAGGHAYAVFSRVGAATLVHHDGEAVTTVVHAVEGTLRPLGVSAEDPRTLWLAHSAERGDTLFRSDDAGQTLTPVLEVAARLEGFAISGDVVWVQSAQLGLHRSTDGGRSFSLVPSGPLGNCLALGPDRRLHACGVPWKDGFALGVSDDGLTFSPVISFFDDIQGAIECPEVPETTTTCDDELAFIREFYGFGAPVTPVEPGPEPSPEASEPSPEGVAGEAERAEPAPPSAASDDGCVGGPGSGGSGLWLAVAALVVASWRGRLTRSRGPRLRSARSEPR